jgi:hypothetical protein
MWPVDPPHVILWKMFVWKYGRIVLRILGALFIFWLLTYGW